MFFSICFHVVFKTCFSAVGLRCLRREGYALRSILGRRAEELRQRSAPGDQALAATGEDAGRGMGGVVFGMGKLAKVCDFFVFCF